MGTPECIAAHVALHAPLWALPRSVDRPIAARGALLVLNQPNWLGLLACQLAATSGRHQPESRSELQFW